MRFTGLLLFAAGLWAADPSGFVTGKAPLTSAGPLAFGPDGILFVGDSRGAAVIALDTGDRSPSAAPKLDVAAMDEKLAALLGTSPDQIRVEDLKVNPISKNVYLSISRGLGPDAIPVILRVDGTGKIGELSLDHIRYSEVDLPGIPSNPRGRRRSSRQLAITELGFSDGKLIVAGLSNEDFSSDLRVIPFPFTRADRGATVEIYHTSHVTWETESPVRSFVPYTIEGQPYLLAVYTCTPLVKIPVAQLKDGAHVTGETIAELGRHSSPLDMIAYRKGGHDYLLVVNTARGVQRLSIDKIESYEAISWPVSDTPIFPTQRISALKGVLQLDKLDDANAVVLTGGREGSALRSIALP